MARKDAARAAQPGRVSSPPLFAGINAAALTPFDADLAVDLDRLAAHCRFLLAEGADHLAVLGTTGEANSLGVDERLGLLEGLVARGIPPECLLPGTGTPAITDTVALTRRAAELGCRGVLMLPPFFYKNPSEDGLFAWFAEVITRLPAAPAILLYHFPQQSAVPFGLALIARLRQAFPGIVRGIKDSSGDFANMLAVLEAFGADGFEVYAGDDSLLLGLLRAGGAGSISAAANVGSRLSAAVHAAFRAGDTPTAEAGQSRLTALRRTLASAPLIPGLKALIARRTGDAGWAHPRPPHLPLGVEAAGRLFAAYDSWCESGAGAA